MARTSQLARAEKALRKRALCYPETVEEFPWGHSAMKVRSKSFAFIVLDDNRLSAGLLSD